MGKRKQHLFLFLIVSVLQTARAQRECIIEIDSANKLWRDSTLLAVQPNEAYCNSYSYHETSLTCSPTHCLPLNFEHDNCAVYQNVYERRNCLPTCHRGCNHGYSCNEQDACPCTDYTPRYNRTKMCAPLPRLQSCTEQQTYENGQCISESCGIACHTAYCQAGRCRRTCFQGFSLNPNTNKCVVNECREKCLEGTCGAYGVCTCNNGFKTDPYKSICVRINCPDEGQTSYCQRECLQSDCARANGYCENGECKCYENFKRDPNKKHNCVRISCPDNEQTSYCQSKCLKSGCTRANGYCDRGVCWCIHGFKEDRYDKHNCVKINCPDNAHREYCQWECKRVGCTGGNCMEGECRCKDGFKKSLESIYQCGKIECPWVNAEPDKKYCASQCTNNCHNGKCINQVFCRCVDGFKKVLESVYECKKISCPSLTVDEPYCKIQCDSQCKNGTCETNGECNCNNSFKKHPGSLYECAKINCPTSAAEDVTDRTFCKNACESHCTNGVCDELGSCTCHKGFNKVFKEEYNCTAISCPASTSEDRAHCVLLCNSTCTNGLCDEKGVCECSQGFVATNFATNMTCHLVCNEDGTCDRKAWIGIVAGGCSLLVVGVIVAAVLVVRRRNRKEHPIKEQEVVQDLPLEPVTDEPEYANFDRHWEMMENDLYQSLDLPSRR